MSSLSIKRPTAPTLWFEAEDRVFALPMYSLDIDTELYVSTALVRLRGTWINSSSRTVDAIFALPFHGAVTSVAAKLGQDRILQTAMVSNEEAKQFNTNYKEQQTTPPPVQSPYERFIPDLFRLPINHIKPNESVEIEVHYIETLQYSAGQYNFKVQLAFSSGMLPKESNISEIVKIRCIINAISKDTRVIYSVDFKQARHIL
jgi:Ca-activated chloride channel family protein